MVYHQGGPRIRPGPLPGHFTGRLSPIRTGVLTQLPHNSNQVACLTRARRHRPRSPRPQQDRLPRPRHTGGRRERQNKLKSITTNGRSNRVTQYARQPRKRRHVGGKYWRERWQLRLCQVGRKLTHDPGQHSGNRGTHQQTGGYTRGIRERARKNRTTNGAFLPHRRAQNSRALRC